MDLKYIGPFEVDIPTLGITVKPGDRFEAIGGTAKSLLNQGLAVRVPAPVPAPETNDEDKAGE
jgi:hypothetical protein